jgi:hypothetical protein
MRKVRYNKEATNRYLTPRLRHLYQHTAIEAALRLVLDLLNTGKRSAQQRQHSAVHSVDEHSSGRRPAQCGERKEEKQELTE